MTVTTGMVGIGPTVTSTVSVPDVPKSSVPVRVSRRAPSLAKVTDSRQPRPPAENTSAATLDVHTRRSHASCPRPSIPRPSTWAGTPTASPGCMSVGSMMVTVGGRFVTVMVTVAEVVAPCWSAAVARIRCAPGVDKLAITSLPGGIVSPLSSVQVTAQQAAPSSRSLASATRRTPPSALLSTVVPAAGIAILRLGELFGASAIGNSSRPMSCLASYLATIRSRLTPTKASTPPASFQIG